MPRVIRVGDEDDDSPHPGDPGPNRMVENDATVWVDEGGVSAGVAAAAAVGAASPAALGLSEGESAELLAEITSDSNGSSGRNAGSDFTRNEYGETYTPGGGDTGGATTVDPSYTVPAGSNPSAGLSGSAPPVAPREQNGRAGPDFNNYAPVQDDEFLLWGVYAPVGRQVDPAIVNIARAMARATGIRLHVNSGYRSRAYNSTLRGAAANSNHMYGVAMDVSMGNLPDDGRRLMLRAAIENGAGGIAVYTGDNFIHIDLDSRRTWKPVPSWGSDLMRAAGYIS